MKIRTFIMLLVLFIVVPILGQNNTIKKVAILETVDKEGKVSYGVKLMVRSKLTTIITAIPGYEGYDRVDISSIMNEHDFQRTGMVSDSDIKRLGEMTGADYVLVAEVAYLNSSEIFISTKILNVETARVERAADIQSPVVSEQLNTNCRNLVHDLFDIKINKKGKFEGELMLEGFQYVGEYTDGHPNGIGIAYFNNNEIYEGEWVYGRREGKGKMIYSDGDVYEGEFKNNVPNGQGIYLFSSGTKRIGYWLNGIIQNFTEYYESGDKRIYSKTINGQTPCRYIYNDGSYYTCNYVNGQKEGKEYSYSRNGVLKSIGYYEKGVCKEVERYENNVIYQKEIFIDKELMEIIVYKNGSPCNKYTYRNGKMIGVE